MIINYRIKNSNKFSGVILLELKLLKTIIIFLLIFNLLTKIKLRRLKNSNALFNEEIIHIGFYEDNVDCGALFRKLKGTFFTHLPKFNIKVTILSKSGINENCLKFTHLDFINVKKSIHNCDILENAIKNLMLDIIVENEHRHNDELRCLIKMKNKYDIKIVQIMHEFPFYHLYNTNLDLFNRNWRNLKQFDAVFGFTPTQIYYYHKQGLNQSIYMPGHLYYEPRDNTPAKLQNKNLIMVGRASNGKRYNLAINALRYIIKEIPDCKLTIVSNPSQELIKLSKDLGVYDHVIFTGTKDDVHKYLVDASIYLLLSDYESYCYALAEAKAFGLANINLGKKYLVLTENGTININNDDPEEIADICIKLLKNQTYLKEEGMLARKSLEQYNYEYLNERYYKVMVSLYNNDFISYAEKEYKKINISKEDSILKEEFELLKKRKPDLIGCRDYKYLFQPIENFHIEKCI